MGKRHGKKLALWTQSIFADLVPLRSLQAVLHAPLLYTFQKKHFSLVFSLVLVQLPLSLLSLALHLYNQHNSLTF